MADSDDKPAIVYDITGFNRSQVVEKLEDIVNDRGYQKKKFDFYLGISKVDETLEFRKLFRLEPRPWRHQPGNGKMTVLLDRQFFGRSYRQCLVELNKKYGCETSLFAEHLEKLFEDNSNIAEYSFVTSEVYILWLFEIARRRAEDSMDATKLKEAYDEHKIDGAITQLIKLMKNDSCQFQEIFLIEGTFHCFSDFPSRRQTAIDNIKEKLKSP